MNQLNSVQETPLVILKQNQKMIFYFILLLVIIYLFNIFGVTLPVLKTGDYAAVLSAGNRNLVKKIALFYMSWFLYLYGTPYFLIIIRRFGTYYFYSDRLEFKSLWGRRIIMPYNQMMVIRKNIGLIIKTTTEGVFSWRNPLQRFKVEYWNRLIIGTMFKEVKVAGMETGIIRGWENPADGPNAIQILKEKAFSFVEE
jgi:hypothetical protein